MNNFSKVGKMSTFLLLFLATTSCVHKELSSTTNKQGVDTVSKGTDQEGCLHWVKSTNNIFKGKDRISIFNIGLAQISVSCSLLPNHFKNASHESLALKGSERLMPLLKPSKDYFSEICFEVPPTESAKRLPHICLGEDFIDGRFTALLTNIDSAAYLFIRSIEIEFSKIFEQDESYHRFILNMMLSAALNRETNWKDN